MPSNVYKDNNRGSICYDFKSGVGSNAWYLYLPGAVENNILNGCI